MGTSPLGQYAAPVAAVVAVGIIAAYIVSLFVPSVPDASRTQLGGLALLAIGAVLGSSVAVNGYKAPINAAHARIDRLQTAITAVAAGSGDPTTVANVGTILEDHRPDDPSGAPGTAAAGG